MKYIIYTLLVLTVTNCKSQPTKNTKLAQMKTFDIETFEKNKTDNEYSFITKDNIEVIQSDDGNEYYETRKSKESYFLLINRYYKTGTLKLTGAYFHPFFQKGIWKEYDEQGNLQKETNYDTPYKFTWEQVLAFIQKRELDMNAYGFEITRSFGYGKQEKSIEEPFWAITYNKNEKEMLLGVVIINGITGKIIKEYVEPYPSED